jgi:sarcosine oxidase, subunit delta
MLLIQCPWCGPRDEFEFRCGGQSHITRPGPPQAVTDRQWGDYLFTRINPKGVHRERWLHQAGCRQWFNVARNTVTHEILSTYTLDQSPPDISAEGVL